MQTDIISPVNYYTGWTIVSGKQGILQLKDGFLSLQVNGEVIFGEPLSAFDKFVFPLLSPGYMQVWLGGKRYRLDFYDPNKLHGTSAAAGAGTALQGAVGGISGAGFQAGSVVAGTKMIQESLKPWRQWLHALRPSGKVRGFRRGIKYIVPWLIGGMVALAGSVLLLVFINPPVWIGLSLFAVAAICFCVWLYRLAKP